MLGLAPVAAVPVAVVGIISTVDVAKSITEEAFCDDTATGAFVAVVNANSQRQTGIVVLIGAWCTIQSSLRVIREVGAVESTTKQNMQNK